MIDDFGTQHRSMKKLGVEIRFKESRAETLGELRFSLGQERCGMFVVLRVVSISCQKTLKILGVVSIQLALDEIGRIFRGSTVHGRNLRDPYYRTI